MAAARALLCYRLVGRSKFALRIVRTSIKCVAFARPLLYQFAVFAQRAIHADKVLLHVLALRIAAARREFTEPPVPDHQIPTAFRTKFIQRNIRYLLALIQPPGGLAIRISGAGHELAETPALQYHHPAAVFAIFFLRDRKSVV